MDPVGAILAGGAGRRMGTDKALVTVAGRPMVEHVAAAFAAAGLEAVVVGRPEPRLAGLPCLPDRVAGRRGPLAGLATALTAGAGRPVLLAAVDQPLILPDTIERLAGMVGNGAAVVPVDDGVRQVTCAAYPGRWAADADTELMVGGSIQSMLDRLDVAEVEPAVWRAWGEDGRSWWSIDTPDDVAEAERRMTTETG